MTQSNLEKCCSGHSTHPAPESLDHVHLSTIHPLMPPFHHCQFRFAQTRASSEYSGSSVKHPLMLSLVKWVRPFVSELRHGESVHVDVEQLLEGQLWQPALMVVIGVVNRLIWLRHGNPQWQLICNLRIFALIIKAVLNKGMHFN